MSTDPPVRRAVLATAFLAAGPLEVLEFLLPLWAGTVLLADPTTVGLLVAVVALAAVAARPLAGRAVDAGAATATVLVGSVAATVGAVAFATASTPAVAFPAGVAAGIGGGLLGPGLAGWAAGDDAVGRFGRLVAAENEGALVLYVVCLTLVGPLGFGAAFGLLALAATAGALVVLTTAARALVPRPSPLPGAAPGPAPSTAALRPLLLFATVTAAAEAGIALVLVVHLQQVVGLGVGAVALVLAPGFLAFVAGPRLAPWFDAVLPRARAVAAGPLVSAVAVAVLAGAAVLAAPAPLGPVVVALAWTVVGAVLGVVLPLEMALVTEAAPGRTGRALSRHELARVAGGGLGSAGLAALYQLGGLPTAGGAAAALLGAAALGGGPVVRRVPSSARRPPRRDAPTTVDAPGTGELRSRARRTLRHWFEHVGLFVAAQVVLWSLDASTVRSDLTGVLPSGPDWLVAVGRIWVVVLAIDTVLAWGRCGVLLVQARRGRAS